MSDTDQEISSRLVTTSALDSVPPALRVSWIAWDSDFRHADLHVGDYIVAVDGVPVPPKLDDKQLSQSIGQYAESQGWAAASAKAGRPLKLSVRRRNMGGSGWQAIDVTGKLVATPSYKTSDGRPAVAPGGPDAIASDGFNDSWGAWYDEKIVPKFRSILDGGWQQSSFTTQYELKMHEQLKPQVDYLVAHYPGTFSRTVLADWQLIANSLAGDTVNLTPEDLQYRKAEDEKIQHVRDAGQAAFTAFQASVADKAIPATPVIDPTQTAPDSVAGKYVILPPIDQHNWLDNGGQTFFAFGDDNSGYWFADEAKSDAQAMLLAGERYRRLVSESLPETYAAIGRVTNQPVLKVIDNRGFYGLQVEIVAAMLGDSCFVDLTKRDPAKENGTYARFTGEDEVDQPMHALPAPDATPGQVMEALFGSLKLGDAKLWKTLYADWRYTILDDGRAILYLHEDGVSDQFWDYSRQSMASRVYGLRLAWVGDVRALTTGKEFDGAPLIEVADVEIDHIGCFDGVYRVFKDTTVNRVWQLQRLNGSPWRIGTLQPI